MLAVTPIPDNSNNITNKNDTSSKSVELLHISQYNYIVLHVIIIINGTSKTIKGLIFATKIRKLGVITHSAWLSLEGAVDNCPPDFRGSSGLIYLDHTI